MLPRSWTSQLRQRKQRPKIFLPFNQARKKTFLLQPGTVVRVDCVRLLVRQSSDLTLMAGHFAVRRENEPSSPLQVADEISGGRFFRSTYISFWIRVRFRVASADGNQFGCFHLLFFLITGTIPTGTIATGMRL